MQIVKRLLIDGNNMMHRMRHAHAALATTDGKPTGVLYGTLQSVRALLDEWSPDICVFAVDDSKFVCWRKVVFPEYKGERVKKRAQQTKEERAAYKEFADVQVPETLKALNSLGLCVINHVGMEADDIIAMLRHPSFTEVLGRDSGIVIKYDDIIVSTDKDFIQLVAPDCRVLNPITQALYYIDKGRLMSNQKEDPIAPDVYAYLARRIVCGDTSDSIPGIKGIGEKTAESIFNRRFSPAGGSFMEWFAMHGTRIEDGLPKRAYLLREALMDTKTRRDVIERNLALMCLIGRVRDELSLFRSGKFVDRNHYDNVNIGVVTSLRRVRHNVSTYGRWLRPRTLKRMPNEFTKFFRARGFQFANSPSQASEFLAPFKRLKAGASLFLEAYDERGMPHKRKGKARAK